MVYKVSSLYFQRCTAGPNINGSYCIRLHTTANTGDNTGAINSQHYWPNNVGSCCVRVQNKAARLLSLPLLSKSKMATTRGKIRRNNYIAVSSRSLPASHSIIVIDNAGEKIFPCSFFPEQTCFSKSKKSTVMLHLFRF